MEAAQTATRATAVGDAPVGSDRSPVPPGPEVSAFLAGTGRAHDWFLNAVNELASELVEDDGELARVVSEQQRLLRQFLDAQRSIVRYWAEVDAEVADIVERHATSLGRSLDSVRSDIATAARPASVETAVHPSNRSGGDAAETQLRHLLDDLWRTEHAVGRSMIEAARSATTIGHSHPPVDHGEDVDGLAPLAEWSPPVAVDIRPDVRVDPTSPSSRVPLDLRELLDTCDDEPGDVLTVVDRLLDRLGSPRLRDDGVAEVRHTEVRAALPPPANTPPAVATAPVPNVPVAPAIGDPDAFARFWGSGRSDERTWRDRPLVQALLPLASGFVLLTAVLAWIG